MLHHVAPADKQPLRPSHWTRKRAGRSHWRTLWRLVVAIVSAMLLYGLYVGMLRLLEDALPAIVITLLAPVSLVSIMAGSARSGRHP